VHTSSRSVRTQQNTYGEFKADDSLLFSTPRPKLRGECNPSHESERVSFFVFSACPLIASDMMDRQACCQINAPNLTPCSLGLSATSQQYFCLRKTRHQQPVSSIFLSEQTSTSHQPNERSVRTRVPGGHRSWPASATCCCCCSSSSCLQIDRFRILAPRRDDGHISGRCMCRRCFLLDASQREIKDLLGLCATQLYAYQIWTEGVVDDSG
jgi:hypothetical protein